MLVTNIYGDFQAEMVSEKMSKKMVEIALMEEQLMIYGKKVYGERFNPRIDLPNINQVNKYKFGFLNLLS